MRVDIFFLIVVKKQILESCDHDYECSVTENANVCRSNSGYGNMALCLCNNGYFEYKLSCIPGDVFALVYICECHFRRAVDIITLYNTSKLIMKNIVRNVSWDDTYFHISHSALS